MPPRAADKFGIYDVRKAAEVTKLGEWIAWEHVPAWLGGPSSVTWPPPDATGVTIAAPEPAAAAAALAASIPGPTPATEMAGFKKA